MSKANSIIMLEKPFLNSRYTSLFRPPSPTTATKNNHQSILILRDRNESIAANNLTIEKKIGDQRFY